MNFHLWVSSAFSKSVRNRVLFFLLLAFMSVSVFAAEGPDPQTPEQIRLAKERIRRDFKGVRAPSVWPKRVTKRPQKHDPKRIPDHRFTYLEANQQVPNDLLLKALLYYDENQNNFPNKNYLSIVDFSPSSASARFYLIHLNEGTIEVFHTTHGNGSVESDPAFATIFGNEIDSNRSSLGFVRTAEIYQGIMGRSLRLDGLSDSNSNLRDRAIVIHGSSDAHEANVVQGVSGGCLMFDWKVKDDILDKIADGSMIFVGVSDPEGSAL